MTWHTRWDVAQIQICSFPFKTILQGDATWLLSLTLKVEQWDLFPGCWVSGWEVWQAHLWQAVKHLGDKTPAKVVGVVRRRRGKKCCSTSVWSKWPCCHICANVSKAIKCMVFFSSRSMNSTRSSPLQSFTSRACSTSQKVFVLKHPVLAGSRKNG